MSLTSSQTPFERIFFGLLLPIGLKGLAPPLIRIYISRRKKIHLMRVYCRNQIEAFLISFLPSLPQLQPQLLQGTRSSLLRPLPFFIFPSFNDLGFSLFSFLASLSWPVRLGPLIYFTIAFFNHSIHGVNNGIMSHV